MIEMIGDLYDNFEDMPVVPSGISPGDLKSQLPADPPLEGASFDEILTETKQKFMPAVTQW
jgi:aromatic-L-amino-acid decarboxylase